jgi:hypothetical protein
MSDVHTAAAQADALYSEVLESGTVWTLRDAGGFPAPMNGDGQRSMPFWSLRSRVERVIAAVPAYASFEVVDCRMRNGGGTGFPAWPTTGSTWVSTGPDLARPDTTSHPPESSPPGPPEVKPESSRQVIVAGRRHCRRDYAPPPHPAAELRRR